MTYKYETCKDCGTTIPLSGICLGFEEWWLGFKCPKLVIFNVYALIMPRRFLADTTCVCTYVLCKIASIFIDVDI